MDLATLEKQLLSIPLIDEHDYECQTCEDTGFQIDEKINKLQYCGCVINRDKAKLLKKLSECLPGNINLDTHEKREYQHSAKKLLKPDADRGIWIHGATGTGKTHLLAMALRTRIEKLPYLVEFKWLKAKALLNLWLDQYGDNKAKAKAEIESIFDVNVIVLDDIDKIGNFTESRESEFFSMLDRLRDMKKIVYATSQFSIKEFCGKMPVEREVSRRDGMGPIEKRFNDLCQEIKI